MGLLQRIEDDFKTAYKAREAETVSILRILMAALKNKKIELTRELSEEDAMAVVKSEAKKLKDALVDFTKAAREDLIEKTKAEVSRLEKYLPEEMSDEELGKIVKEAIAEIGATTKAELGKVIGAVVKKVAGRAEGHKVKEAVEKEIGE